MQYRTLKGEKRPPLRRSDRKDSVEERVGRLDLTPKKRPRRRLVSVAIVLIMLVSALSTYAMMGLDEPPEEPPQRAGTFAYIEFSEVLRPNGDSLAQWDYPTSPADHYTEVDETTAGGDDDTTYISTSTNDEYDRFTMTDMVSEDRGEYTEIDSVTLWVLAKKAASSFASLQIGLWNDTVYYLGVDVSSTLTTSYYNYTWTWDTNPATSSEWTIGQVNAFCSYVFTEDATPTVSVTQMGLLVPGRQIVWAPTFTSTPDTNAVPGYEYNYTVTTNESASFDVDITFEDPTTYWLNDSQDFIYRYKDSSATEAYVSGNSATTIWGLIRFCLFQVDLSALPDNAELDTIYIDIYRTYQTASGPQCVNRTNAWGGTNGSYSGIWDSDFFKALMPDGTKAFDGTTDGGWDNFTGDASGWQTQFDTNKTIYLALTGWSFAGDSTSYGWNLSDARIDIEYTITPTEWLTWDPINHWLAGTPTDADNDTYVDVDIEATSLAGGSSAWQNFTIYVGSGWAPTFTSSPTTVGSAEVLYEYTATCNETVTWPADDSITTNATWLSWGQSNHTAWGTPATEDIGYYYVNISATSDEGELTAYQNYTLTISAYDVTPPTAVAEWGYNQSSSSARPDVQVNQSYYDSGLTLWFCSGFSSDNIGIVNWTWNWTVDGGSLSQNFSANFTRRPVDAGVHAFNLTVRDAAGLIGYDTFSFTVNQSDILRPDEAIAEGVWTAVGAVGNDTIDDPNPYYTSSPWHDGNTTYYDGTASDSLALILGIDDWLPPGSDDSYDYNVTLFFWALTELTEESTLSRAGLYYSGTPYYNAVSIGTAYSNHTIAYDECPWTSAEWTRADINATQVYFRDLVDGDKTRITMVGLIMTYVELDLEDPVANAGPDQEVDEGDTVTFDGSGSTDNVGITNYTWNFTDGTEQTLYGVSPQYLFTTNGTYIITLNVTDAAGNWDTDTMIVTVVVPTPTFAQRVYANMGDYTLLLLCAVGLFGMMLTPAWYAKYGHSDKAKSLIYAIFWFTLFFGLFYAGVYAFL